ncbi:GAF domain-containing protein [Streptomyces sp. NBC_00347]|uniref:GAF domain-containing protein n=1 Tax=Streptomyces sp. NBC_00347 TaxID=2975721 RepID=UPI002B1E751F|nr:GAF domain-containing protein [Streptomyces sp. NBC_00347]
MNEQLLAKAFVELADNLVADFDLIDFLRLLTDNCVGMLGVNAAGVLLADLNGELRVMAASDEHVRVLELFQLQNDEGPCLECFHTGAPVTVPDLATEAARWPRFAEQALRSGYSAVQTVPMRLRDEVVGALNLFRTRPGPFDRPPRASPRPWPTSPPSASSSSAPPGRARCSTSSCRPP